MSDLRERVDALVKKLRGTIQDADGWPKQSYLDGVHDAADKFRALLAQSEEAKPAPADCLCSSWVGKANPACPVHGTPPASAGTEGVGGRGAETVRHDDTQAVRDMERVPHLRRNVVGR